MKQGKWYKCEIGDYIDYFHLVEYGGKFYHNKDGSFCDMPTMSFKLDPIKGYVRIE